MKPEIELSDDLHMKKGRYRFVILAIVGLKLSMVLGCVITFNAAFVSMQDITTSPLYPAFINRTLLDPDWASSELSWSDRRFDWTPMMRALSFAGSFGGNVVCVQPMVQIIRRFGVHKSMTFIG
ncbi:hypothetical protein PENTCL1PPCAC_28040, partial [Pristionchus entomophagus]